MPGLLARRRWRRAAEGSNPRSSRSWVRSAFVALAVASLLAAGAWLRWVSPLDEEARRWREWVGGSPGVVTLYFKDGPFFVPVSRRLGAGGDRPQVVLETLLAGPDEGSGLERATPAGLELRHLAVVGGVAHIDLSAAGPLADPDLAAAKTAIANTLTTLPGVRAVELRVDGQPVGGPVARVPLLYYVGSYGLVGVPAGAATAREALAAYLAGPSDERLLGLPRDVQVIRYEHDPAAKLASVKFNYPESVRSLALARPGEVRLVLVGLIATLTEFPDVEAVRLDFGGRRQLGLGQCSDLLRTPQPRPRILNDERLLGRIVRS